MKAYDGGIALDIFEAIPAGFTDGLAEFKHNGVEFLIRDIHGQYGSNLTVIARCSMEHSWSEVLFAITKDFLELYFSETTNNDACEIRITEKSAHHGDFEGIRVEAELLDYLT